MYNAMFSLKPTITSYFIISYSPCYNTTNIYSACFTSPLDFILDYLDTKAGMFHHQESIMFSVKCVCVWLVVDIVTNKFSCCG